MSNPFGLLVYDEIEAHVTTLYDDEGIPDGYETEFVGSEDWPEVVVKCWAFTTIVYNGISVWAICEDCSTVLEAP